jgi:hypothetical protein
VTIIDEVIGQTAQPTRASSARETIRSAVQDGTTEGEQS